METGLSELITSLQSDGLHPDESRLMIESAFEKWIESVGVPSALPVEIRRLLARASWASRTNAPAHTTYLELIKKIERIHTPTRRDAVILLSQLSLILVLAEDFNNSPARIARLLGSTDMINHVSWKAIQSILVLFGVRNELDVELVSALISKDKIASAEEFGDADERTVAELICNQSCAYGMDEGFSKALMRLIAPVSEPTFIPYLQILLYVAVIDHFYDHPSEYIYTFKPRGAVANLIFGNFPAVLAPGGNPMLNNFKAINRITMDWAESRDDNREQAKALVKVVISLSALPYPARKQISSTIRRGIIRFIEVRTPSAIILPSECSYDDAIRFVGNVASIPTNTRGIIEQRLTDFIGAYWHQESNWRSRGLGDPVNATNTSSRKLGDCDFQNSHDYRCSALEAHAGRLTNIYFFEHLRTLRLNLPARIAEWNKISDIAEWQLKVIFLVHESSMTVLDPPELLDLRCDFVIKTYSEFLAEISNCSELDKLTISRLFKEWVIDPLNSPKTPQYAKQKALDLLTT